MKTDNEQILKGLLDTLVLNVLTQGENYGFGIREALHQQNLGGGGARRKGRTFFPLLHRLERRELLISYRRQPGERGTPRKYYKITDLGRNYLRTKKTAEWRKVAACLSVPFSLTRTNLCAYLASLDSFHRNSPLPELAT